MGLDIYFSRIKKTSDDLVYFRKVNFLVGFVEEQTQDYVPNLQGIEFTKEMAEELKDRCERVLANHGLAQILLPTTKGCFFGNYEYNDIYFKEVKGVLDELNNTIIPLYEDLDEDEYVEFAISY